MAAPNDIDLLVIGGGCAGLSLARMLARYRSSVRTLVVEPRSDYSDDRTWCFWHTEQHRFQHLVSRRWDAWRFSAKEDAVVQAGNSNMLYQCLRSIDFYEDALQLIADAQRVELATGVTATSVAPSSNGFTVETSAGPIHARYVVDTRPAIHNGMDRDGLWQVFTGAEVETDHDVFDPNTVGLMENMSTDQNGFRFTYTLPFSRRHALVEETRFTHKNVAAAELKRGLDQTLASLPCKTKTLRTESGRLPMAAYRPITDMPDGFVTAGIGGGAIRASTGYAFLRIQRWASNCAYRIHRGESPRPHPAEPRWRAAIDGLFLRVLRAQPELGPRLFMAMAKGLSAKTLVRFLSDEGRPSDFARVAYVLPKAPFVRNLVRPVAPTLS